MAAFPWARQLAGVITKSTKSTVTELPQSLSLLGRIASRTGDVAVSAALLPVAGAAKIFYKAPVTSVLAAGGAAAVMMHKHNKHAAEAAEAGSALPPELAASQAQLDANQTQLNAAMANLQAAQAGPIASQPTVLAPASQIAVAGPVVQATPAPTMQVTSSVPQGTMAPPPQQLGATPA